MCNDFNINSTDNSQSWNFTITTNTYFWYGCPKCGILNPQYHLYCSNCGYELKPKSLTIKEVISKIDDLIKELNELKAGIINE